jgi:dienelactone hydrolase
MLLSLSMTSCSHAARCGAPTTAPTPAGVQMLHFSAADGVVVTADLYAPHPPAAPMIVLFHQAGYSRGEYRPIAPRLNELGFNALAVDTRSGEASQGVGNDTAASACGLGKPMTFVDAVADMRAAIVEARKHAQGKLLVWGSSYTSALVLVLGGELGADGVLAFSPGEYFTDLGKPKTWVADSAARLSVPVFITSAKSEHDAWAPIAAHIAHVTTFVPDTAGHHGSSTLWPAQPDRDAYWTAVTTFLAQFH